MKDFYGRLGVEVGASGEAIGKALEGASADLREEAGVILLNDRRRAVYDRNYRLLTTIGQLRAHLGLSYTRFWARQEYKPFWQELSTAPPRRGRRVDAALIAGAFMAVGRHGRKHVTHKSNWLMALIVICMVILAIVIFRVLR